MRFIEFLGVAVFAISGALAGARKGFDLFGVAVIAIVTAVGGGTLRDLLLDRHPVFWIGDPGYFWAALAATAAALIYARLWVATRKALLIADALGMAFFAIGGTQIALNTGQLPVIAVLMGMTTGVAGGMLRDLLIGEVPLILRPGRLYATAAILGATAFLLLRPLPAAPWIGMAVAAGIRLLAIRYELVLPVVAVPPESDEHPVPPRGTP